MEIKSRTVKARGPNRLHVMEPDGTGFYNSLFRPLSPGFIDRFVGGEPFAVFGQEPSRRWGKIRADGRGSDTPRRVAPSGARRGAAHARLACSARETSYMWAHLSFHRTTTIKAFPPRVRCALHRYRGCGTRVTPRRRRRRPRRRSRTGNGGTPRGRLEPVFHAVSLSGKRFPPRRDSWLESNSSRRLKSMQLARSKLDVADITKKLWQKIRETNLNESLYFL